MSTTYMVCGVTLWTCWGMFPRVLLLNVSPTPLPQTTHAHAVEVCLKSNSNANPAEIKALVERYAQLLL